MYDYLNEQGPTNIVGSFKKDKNADFKNQVKAIYENFNQDFQLDLWEDVGKILKNDVLKESYKEQLLGDVLTESLNDEWYDMHKDKLEQLFENSALEVITENVGAMNPIVGFTLPILKKNYYENVAKDIMMTEVPDKPFVKVAFERGFLKDTAGTKYYIPDIFYNDDYKTVYAETRGESFDALTIIGNTLPKFGFDTIGNFFPGRGIMTRDTLAYDFGIRYIQIEQAWPAGTTSLPADAVPGTAPTDIGGQIVQVKSDISVTPDFASNGVMSGDLTFRYPESFVPAGKTDPEIVTLPAGTASVFETGLLFGRIDAYNGFMDLSLTFKTVAGRATAATTIVGLMGHLSNENNNRTVELDYERETRDYKIEDGPKLNTGLTLEKIKDTKALLNIDITSKIISDMTTVLTNFEDNDMLGFLTDSFDVWKDKSDLPFGFGAHISKGKFVERARFSAIPPSSVMVTQSQWIDTELKFNVDRLLDQLKQKLYNKDIMFVIYGNPAMITLLNNQVKWVVDEDSKIGGVQLEYKFGVLTNSKTRVHVVSTQKVSESLGLRIVAYPLTEDTITFKHYKYSLNIENMYRNPITPNIPNIMATQRVKTIELLPVQGSMLITNTGFGNYDTRNSTPDTPGYRIK